MIDRHYFLKLGLQMTGHESPKRTAKETLDPMSVAHAPDLVAVQPCLEMKSPKEPLQCLDTQELESTSIGRFSSASKVAITPAIPTPTGKPPLTGLREAMHLLDRFNRWDSPTSPSPFNIQADDDQDVLLSSPDYRRARQASLESDSE